MRKNKHVNEPMYTVEEIAERLRVSVQTVRKWIRKKELTAMKLDREYRVRESSLNEFIKRREQG